MNRRIKSKTSNILLEKRKNKKQFVPQMARSVSKRLLIQVLPTVIAFDVTLRQ